MSDGDGPLNPRAPRPGTGRRGVASIVVLVVAGLAVAGTTPAPTRPPTLQKEATGILELGPDGPMASVDVTVTATAALLADATNRTSVTASRVNALGETADDPIVVLAIEVVGNGKPAITGTGPTLLDSLTDACRAAADCTRTYRITAVLAGPADGPVPVGWRLVAESRTGTDAKPGVAPPGATLSVVAGDAVWFAGRSTAATVSSEGVRLDPMQPRFVRRVTVVTPPHQEGSLVLALRSAVQRDRTDRTFEVASIHVVSADNQPLASYGYAGIQDVHLPACTDPDGCRSEILVLGDWRGGRPDDGATVDWTLGASLFSLDPDVRVERRLKLEAGDLAELPARAAGRVTGTLATGGKTIQHRSVEVTFDRSAVEGEVGGDAREVRSGVALEAVLTGTTSSRSGSTTFVLVHAGQGFDSQPVGKPIGVTSEAIPVSCVGSTCTATIDLEAWDYETSDGDVTFDWALDVALVLDPGVTVDPDAVLSFHVVEAHF